MWRVGSRRSANFSSVCKSIRVREATALERISGRINPAWSVVSQSYSLPMWLAIVGSWKTTRKPPETCGGARSIGAEAPDSRLSGMSGTGIVNNHPPDQFAETAHRQPASTDSSRLTRRIGFPVGTGLRFKSAAAFGNDSRSAINSNSSPSAPGAARATWPAWLRRHHRARNRRRFRAERLWDRARCSDGAERKRVRGSSSVAS
jgi:hypothetical protein